jgi:hypothetical protein
VPARPQLRGANRKLASQVRFGTRGKTGKLFGSLGEALLQPTKRFPGARHSVATIAFRTSLHGTIPNVGTLNAFGQLWFHSPSMSALLRQDSNRDSAQDHSG